MQQNNIQRSKKKKKIFQIQLAEQLLTVKKTDNLYTGRENMFENTKQDWLVERWFTVEM